MIHSTLIAVAVTLGAVAPEGGRGEGGHAEAFELVAEVTQLGALKDYASAAQLAAKTAAREDLPAATRVLFGGLARENFELSYGAGGGLGELCGLTKVMRLVAPLDSPAGAAAKLKAAEDAEARLEGAVGSEWRAVCSPAVSGASVETTTAKLGEGVAVAPTPEPPRPSVTPQAMPTLDRARRRYVRAGVGTLGAGLLLLAPMAAVLAYRAQGERSLWSLNSDAMGRQLTEPEAQQAEALRQRYWATTAGAAVLGATGAALVVTGAVLLATGTRQSRVAVAPWGGRGVGGLVVAGRF